MDLLNYGVSRYPLTLGFPLKESSTSHPRSDTKWLNVDMLV